MRGRYWMVLALFSLLFSGTTASADDCEGVDGEVNVVVPKNLAENLKSMYVYIDQLSADAENDDSCDRLPDYKKLDSKMKKMGKWGPSARRAYRIWKAMLRLMELKCKGRKCDDFDELLKRLGSLIDEPLPDGDAYEQMERLLDELERKLAKAERANKKAGDELQKLRDENARLQAENQRLQDENARLQAENQRLRDECQKTDCKDQNDEIQRLSNDIQGLADENARLKKELEDKKCPEKGTEPPPSKASIQKPPAGDGMTPESCQQMGGRVIVYSKWNGEDQYVGCFVNENHVINASGISLEECKRQGGKTMVYGFYNRPEVYVGCGL